MSQAERESPMQSKMRLRIVVVLTSSLLLCAVSLPAQAPASANPSADQRAAEMEQRLNEVTAALNQTQQTLEQSMEEIKRLRSQLDSLRGQLPKPATGEATAASAGSSTSTSSSTSADTIERLHEEQEAMQSEIKLHEQTKVETASKYPLRVTGLILFNAFSNAGTVDNLDLPGLALNRAPNVPHGSSGASLRQSLIGIEGTGPRLWRARSTAEASVDFFGGLTYNQYGYSSSTGSLVELRYAKVSLDWDRTTIDAGQVTPLITPLSPTSFATVARPSLSSAGNLWTWSPQARIEQRVPLSAKHLVGLEFGLLDVPAPYATAASIQGSSPSEASRHPGVEGRISYRESEQAAGSRTPLLFGLGAYTSDQLYGATHVHSWAATADWQIPLSRWLALSGEAYRGRALGGLGGGVYKNVLTGTAPNGATVTEGVDTVGGWSQLKLRFSPTLEANASFGLDDALASNFRRLVLPTGTSAMLLYSRNSMFVGNVVYRPKSYLIFSPEFRRILTWPSVGSGNISNVFTLSAGYQF